MEDKSKGHKKPANYESIKEYLIKKYKRTLLVVNTHESDDYSESKMIENLEDVILEVLDEALFFKMFIMTSEGPVIFVLVDMKYNEVADYVEEIKRKSLLASSISIEVI